MTKLTKAFALFSVGGILYYIIEFLWRGHSHPSMIFVGGLCFVLIGGLNEIFTWNDPLIAQGVCGAAIVTVVELAAGLILNITLGLDVWDYSDMPFNFLGQICLPYSLLWIVLAIIAVIVDDWLRYYLFNEDRPHYRVV